MLLYDIIILLRKVNKENAEKASVRVLFMHHRPDFISGLFLCLMAERVGEFNNDLNTCICNKSNESKNVMR